MMATLFSTGKERGNWPEMSQTKFRPTPSRHHTFSAYTKLSEKLKFLTPWYVYVWEYYGVRNVCFSENFTYLLNG